VIARTFSLAVFIATVVACGGRSTDIPPSTSDTDSGSGAADATEADAALPPGVAFMEGYVACCETGRGQSCCTAEQKEAGECVEFRGCTPAGGGFYAKITCSKCCDGLSVISRAQLVDGTCVYPPFHEVGNVCAACGDGVCEAPTGENPCNCPADCGPPP